MKQYIDLMKHILEHGQERNDRTGTGTLGIFGHQMRFDLRKAFPAVTTKKLAWKAMTSELLWFLEGSTNERRLAEILYGKDRSMLYGKTTIWTANAEKQGAALGYSDGILGPVYGRIWRTKYIHTMDVVEVSPKYNTSKYTKPTFERLTPSVEEFCGTRYTNKNGDTFTVISKHSVQRGNSQYVVQFDNTGYITTSSRPNIKRGMVSDPFANTVYGVACFGIVDLAQKAHPLYSSTYNMWHNMVARCYSPSHPCYALYGGKGVSVCDRWLVFSNFLSDIHKIPGYEYWRENTGEYDIDKDYYQSTVYSPDTTIFLETWYNKLLSSDYVPIEVHGIGKFLSVKHFLQHVGSNVGSWYVLKRFKAGEKWKGYSATILDKQNLRYNRVIDQVSTLINDLKNDPFSRRHILTAWDIELLNKQALPPCHCFAQFYVNADMELSCQLYQRSCDVFLGLPFNIASYALLTHMIAQVSGLKVGEFVWSGGDVHIYKNHMEQVQEQILREPKELPQLWIDTSIKDIDSFTMDSFRLENYDPMDSIKAPMAV